ncbi:MAG: hypothetical protein AAB531_01885 [Patescibacteria group bacterium]
MSYFTSVFGIPNGYEFFPVSFSLLKIAIWIFLFLLTRWVLGKRATTILSELFKDKYSFNFSKEKDILTEERLVKEWILQGNVFVSEDGLIISNSNSGCLIRPRFIFSRIWKNFTAKIEIEFTTQLHDINNGNNFNNILGILFRAQNFDDYFMIEINYINKHIVVRPHIRVGGNFDAPELNPDFNSYPIDLSENMHLNIELVVRENKATLYVNGDRESPLIWILPDYAEPRLIQHAGGVVKDGSKTLISEVYFKKWAGMFGFRNYPNELALVKSLKIF